MKTIRTSNAKASQYTTEKKDFKGNNIFAETKNGVYKVYSYGYHFPLYAYKEGEWYKNDDSYSHTTAKHFSQACPLGVRFTVVNTEEIQSL